MSEKNKNRTLGPLLQRYINLMARSRPALTFREIVGIAPGQNMFRHLLKRGLIKEWTPPTITRYVLTAKGWSLVRAHKWEDAMPKQKTFSGQITRRLKAGSTAAKRVRGSKTKLANVLTNRQSTAPRTLRKIVTADLKKKKRS